MEAGNVTARGRCVTVPVSLAGVTVLWMVSAGFLLWRTFWDGNDDAAGMWGLFFGMVATSWTVLYGLSTRRDMLIRAFELGRDASGDEVSGVSRIR